MLYIMYVYINYMYLWVFPVSNVLKTIPTSQRPLPLNLALLEVPLKEISVGVHNFTLGGRGAGGIFQQ